MSKFERYYNFMDSYTEFYREVQNVEYEKLDALLSNDLTRIQKTMQNYETYIKKAQQFENDRIELCKELGFENMAYSEVLRHFQGMEKLKLSRQKNSLEAILKTVQYLNKKSLEYADMQMSFAEGDAATYNAKGKADSRLGSSGILNKQV